MTSTRKASRALLQQISDLSPHAIDALYGLDPVYEPSGDHLPLHEHLPWSCPYCAQANALDYESYAGSDRLIVDCETCCRPAVLDVHLIDGSVAELRVSRHDD